MDHPVQSGASIGELLPETLAFDPATFDFSAVPGVAAVFLVATAGDPYIGRSAFLSRRLKKLLGEPAEAPSRRLNLRGAARSVRFRATGSAFETSLVHYRVLRAAFPERYREMMRLRTPPLLKVSLANEWPRGSVTRRLTRGPGLYFGPFPSRASADKVAAGFFDLFRVRRCVEAIHPDPKHPGCIYGEMGMCLRPCQDACGAGQYAEEVANLTGFLNSGGASLLRQVEAERDQASDGLDFEEAARLHKFADKIHAALKQAPDLARDLDRLHGVVIQNSAPAATPGAELFPVWRGYLLPQITIRFDVVEGKPVSLDARLKELLAAVQPSAGPSRIRSEHLALLARWYYRGTRKGEFIAFDSFDRLPYRRIAGAISRVVRGAKPDPQGEEPQSAH